MIQSDSVWNVRTNLRFIDSNLPNLKNSFVVTLKFIFKLSSLWKKTYRLYFLLWEHLSRAGRPAPVSELPTLLSELSLGVGVVVSEVRGPKCRSRCVGSTVLNSTPRLKLKSRLHFEFKSEWFWMQNLGSFNYIVAINNLKTTKYE